MQVAPDSSGIYLAMHTPKRIADIVYKGPGFYCFPHRTILCICINRLPSKIWYTGDCVQYFIWNCPLEDTIFGPDPLPPIQQDAR